MFVNVLSPPCRLFASELLQTSPHRRCFPANTSPSQPLSLHVPTPTESLALPLAGSTARHSARNRSRADSGTNVHFWVGDTAAMTSVQCKSASSILSSARLSSSSAMLPAASIPRLSSSSSSTTRLSSAAAADCMLISQLTGGMRSLLLL